MRSPVLSRRTLVSFRRSANFGHMCTLFFLSLAEFFLCWIFIGTRRHGQQEWPWDRSLLGCSSNHFLGEWNSVPSCRRFITHGFGCWCMGMWCVATTVNKREKKNLRRKQKGGFPRPFY